MANIGENIDKMLMDKIENVFQFLRKSNVEIHDAVKVYKEIREWGDLNPRDKIALLKKISLIECSLSFHKQELKKLKNKIIN